MEVKVVTGANYGDEGKGMVSYALANEAVQKNKKVLTVFYNGGIQRAHTANGQILHCIGAGNLVGGTTYYDKMFVVDPIALWLTNSEVIIHPQCRMVLPCDVMRNREKEIARGVAKHGSCGLGIFECVKRSKNPNYKMIAFDVSVGAFHVYDKARNIHNAYSYDLNDELYTMDNFIKACEYVRTKCRIAMLELIAHEFDTIIFEGGQGLLLDQQNIGDFPHLTPSSVGSYNIHETIKNLGAESNDIYYVSRSYMTRHGAGPMEEECAKADINASIVDATNMPNDWQGSLRFGFLKTDSLYRRIAGDFSRYENATANMVFTQLNYTNGKLATGIDTFEEIQTPDFITNTFLSDQKDIIVRA